MIVVAGIILSFIWGTIWGSFGGTIIYRTNRGISLLKPPSLCPICGKHLHWLHKIPILSYIVLKGRCYFCGAKISPFYIVTEFLSGLIGVFAFIFSDPTGSFLLNFFFFWSLLILTISDIIYLSVPVLNIVIAMMSAIVFQVIHRNYTDMLWGILVGVSIPLIISLVYRFIRRKEGLGEGDILIMFAVGAYFGFSKTLIVLILSTVLGGIISAVLLVLGRSKDSMIPFIPFVFVSAIIVFLLRERYPAELIPGFLQ